MPCLSQLRAGGLEWNSGETHEQSNLRAARYWMGGVCCPMREEETTVLFADRVRDLPYSITLYCMYVQ